VVRRVEARLDEAHEPHRQVPLAVRPDRERGVGNEPRERGREVDQRRAPEAGRGLDDRAEETVHRARVVVVAARLRLAGERSVRREVRPDLAQARDQRRPRARLVAAGRERRERGRDLGHEGRERPAPQPPGFLVVAGGDRREGLETAPRAAGPAQRRLENLHLDREARPVFAGAEPHVRMREHLEERVERPASGRHREDVPQQAAGREAHEGAAAGIVDVDAGVAQLGRDARGEIAVGAGHEHGGRGLFAGERPADRARHLAALVLGIATRAQLDWTAGRERLPLGREPVEPRPQVRAGDDRGERSLAAEPPGQAADEPQRVRGRIRIAIGREQQARARGVAGRREPVGGNAPVREAHEQVAGRAVEAAEVRCGDQRRRTARPAPAREPARFAPPVDVVPRQDLAIRPPGDADPLEIAEQHFLAALLDVTQERRVVPAGQHQRVTVGEAHLVEERHELAREPGRSLGPVPQPVQPGEARREQERAQRGVREGGVVEAQQVSQVVGEAGGGQDPRQ